MKSCRSSFEHSSGQDEKLGQKKQVSLPSERSGPAFLPGVMASLGRPPPHGCLLNSLQEKQQPERNLNVFLKEIFIS